MSWTTSACAQRPVLREVAALCDPPAVDRGEPRGERARLEGRDDVPVLGGDELHPLALALDDEPRRHGLHAARGEPLHDLAPEDRRDLVAVETVEDAARLLRVDEPSSISRVSPSARSIAGRVISWNTMRRTGTFGSSTSRRCQAIASPSRSSSVASRSSSASFSFAFRSETTFFLRESTT